MASQNMHHGHKDYLGLIIFETADTGYVYKQQLATLL